MMGPRQEAQAALFYEFSLEDHVPQDHLLRSIDRFVDLSSIRAHLADFYSHTGRPSIDPELLIRMLLVGYCLGIRSERRLCEEVHLNLAYRWFCRLDLTDRIPDHSTFSKNRHGRFRESDLLREVFEMTVARCMQEGLVGGQGFAVDASLISADVQKQNSSNPEDWAVRETDPNDAPRAVREYLDVLDDEAFGAASEVTDLTRHIGAQRHGIRFDVHYRSDAPAQVLAKGGNELLQVYLTVRLNRAELSVHMCDGAEPVRRLDQSAARLRYAGYLTALVAQ